MIFQENDNPRPDYSKIQMSIRNVRQSSVLGVLFKTLQL